MSTCADGVEWLFRSVLFRRVSPAVRQAALRTARSCRFAPAEFICRQGEPVGRGYVITGGRVSVCRVSSAGKETILRFHFPGDAFGFAHAIAGVRAVASLQASQESTAVAWDRADCIGLLRRHPRMLENFACVMVQQHDELWTHLEEALVDSCERRLAAAFRRGFGVAPFDGDGGTLQLTERQIAEYLGASPYTVSRILSRWRRDGVIDVRRGKVRVLAPGALPLLAQRFGGL